MATTTGTPTPQISALQSLLQPSTSTPSPQSPHAPHLTNLARQIAHNLEHQHNWRDIQFHTHSPTSPSTLLPRPLLSGLPPQRLYIHPDEQISLLQTQKERGGTGMGEVLPEREWVLPSHLREKWSLRRFGEVFDGIGMVPPEVDGEEGEGSEWRTTKRVLLATLDDDSTVVYYIVHDGIVKPRQN